VGHSLHNEPGESINLVNSPKSCDPTLSRQEFVRKLLKKAAAAGTLLYVGAIADSFVAPPARAAVSGATTRVVTSTRVETSIGFVTEKIVNTVVVGGKTIFVTDIITNTVTNTLTNTVTDIVTDTVTVTTASITFITIT
jgi:hypothetical protein